MSPEDAYPDDSGDDGSDGEEIPIEVEPSGRSPRRRLGEEADRAVEQFDQSVIDLLAWILDTETRSRIYVYLRKYPGSTSEEIAEGTGLYPSTVREALAELHDEGTVTRTKRESAGAGNNPYEYRAIAPSELVSGMVQQVQDELNTIFNLDRMLDRDGPTADVEPITITVDDVDDGASTPESEGRPPEDGDSDADGPNEDEPDDTDDGR